MLHLLFKAQLKLEEMKKTLPRVMRNWSPAVDAAHTGMVWQAYDSNMTLNPKRAMKAVRTGAGLSWIEFSVKACIHGSCQSQVDEIKSWQMAVKRWNTSIMVSCVICVIFVQHQFPLIRSFCFTYWTNTEQAIDFAGVLLHVKP